MRFPSSQARRAESVPFEGDLLRAIDPTQLADNQNYDAERRLMYVALTRAERYLFISKSGLTKSGTQTQSSFWRQLIPLVGAVGGVAPTPAASFQLPVEHSPTEERRDLRLVTSFSDLRYFLECPHDFYLRKVLGFAPTIDQAFGYGRGVHNLMRAVHSNPSEWAVLARDPAALRERLEQLVEQG